MRQSILLALFAALAMAGPMPAALSDVLLLDSIDQARASAGAQPSRGMTMQQVEARFGAPAKRRSAVGQPPITRWEYNDFIVYFEYRHVITTVSKRS